jgi:glucose-fructose oxidoreductase
MAKKDTTRVRYAVLGQGFFAQAAVLPAFASAENSELVALFSSSDEKLEALAKQYGVQHALHYEAYDDFLSTGAIDAVYIALPNSQHADFAVRAARAGVHVLCEKPMAVTEEECERMIEECDSAHVKLMIAYRLHFERANLEAIQLANSGTIGEPRVFNSTFCMQVRPGNSRLKADLGGGPLYDIGIYCINAARNIFRSEPLSVFAFSGTPDNEERFSEVEEQFAATLQFPRGRIASFVTSFGAADVSQYEVIGTKGKLRVDPAYDVDADLKHELVVGGVTKRRTFRKRDQVAPELIYFSDCILDDKTPEPSGREGLADVRVITALLESAKVGERVDLDPFQRRNRPSMKQQIHVPPHPEAELVGAEVPHQ